MRVAQFKIDVDFRCNINQALDRPLQAKDRTEYDAVDNADAKPPNQPVTRAADTFLEYLDIGEELPCGRKGCLAKRGKPETAPPAQA